MSKPFPTDCQGQIELLERLEARSYPSEWDRQQAIEWWSRQRDILIERNAKAHKARFRHVVRQSYMDDVSLILVLILGPLALITVMYIAFALAS